MALSGVPVPAVVFRRQSPRARVPGVAVWLGAALEAAQLESTSDVLVANVVGVLKNESMNELLVSRAEEYSDPVLLVDEVKTRLEEEIPIVGLVVGEKEYVKSVPSEGMLDGKMWDENRLKSEVDESL